MTEQKQIEAKTGNLLKDYPTLSKAIDQMTTWTLDADIKSIEHQTRRIEKWHEIDEKQEKSQKSKAL